MGRDERGTLARFRSATEQRKHLFQDRTMRSADRVRKCLLLGVDRTYHGHHETDAFVESPEGLSPSGAPRTVREPLDSHGSRCSAVAMTKWPMGKELRCRPAQPVEPVSPTLGLMNHPLEFAACPSIDIGIDPLQSRTQPRRVE